MREMTAKKLTDLLARHAGEQNDLLAEIEHIETPQEFNRVKIMIAHTMGAIFLEALNPIFEEYPHIKPPHLV